MNKAKQKQKYEISHGSIRKIVQFRWTVLINGKTMRTGLADSEEDAQERMRYFAENEFNRLRYDLGIDRVTLKGESHE